MRICCFQMHKRMTLMQSLNMFHKALLKRYVEMDFRESFTIATDNKGTFYDLRY